MRRKKNKTYVLSVHAKKFRYNIYLYRTREQISNYWSSEIKEAEDDRENKRQCTYTND